MRVLTQKLNTTSVVQKHENHSCKLQTILNPQLMISRATCLMAFSLAITMGMWLVL